MPSIDGVAEELVRALNELEKGGSLRALVRSVIHHQVQVVGCTVNIGIWTCCLVL